MAASFGVLKNNQVALVMLARVVAVGGAKFTCRMIRRTITSPLTEARFTCTLSGDMKTDTRRKRSCDEPGIVVSPISVTLPSAPESTTSEIRGGSALRVAKERRHRHRQDQERQRQPVQSQKPGDYRSRGDRQGNPAGPFRGEMKFTRRRRENVGTLRDAATTSNLPIGVSFSPYRPAARWPARA